MTASSARWRKASAPRSCPAMAMHWPTHSNSLTAFFERANMAGSILVITDRRHLKATCLSSPLPVQFWSIQSPQAPVTPEIQKRAGTVNSTHPSPSSASTTPTCKQIAHRAQSDFANASNDALGNRWQDGGYTLLPLLGPTLFAQL